MQSQYSSLRKHPTRSRPQKLWSQRKTPNASLAASLSPSCPGAHHRQTGSTIARANANKTLFEESCCVRSVASEAFVPAELPHPSPPTPAHRQQEATKICRNTGARRGAVTVNISLHNVNINPSPKLQL